MKKNIANKKNIIKYAEKIGIDLIGFAKAQVDPEEKLKLKKYIMEGRHGSMAYLEDFEKRINPQNLLENAKSVIVIAVNYYRATPDVPHNFGKIARYAYGRDYHKALKTLLKKLELFIKKKYPPAKTRICIDSSLLLEKSYAVKAGIGFIGKNTGLITKEFGSYVLLGELITDLEFEYDRPYKGTCGTCDRCIKNCPTKAIKEPYKLDARRCISYLTIENKNEIPEKFHRAIGNCLFGCDKCQEVCPYNKTFAKPASNKDLKNKIAGSTLNPEEILKITTDGEYLKRFAGSPLMRAKRKGLQRNAKIVLQNAQPGPAKTT